MKKLFFTIAALLGICMFVACAPDNEDKIVGKWVVTRYRSIVHDITSGTYEDVTYTETDTEYPGYDTVEFKADGTTLWHMNDYYVQSGLFSNPYREYDWLIRSDKLYIYSGTLENNRWDYSILELNRNKLYIEGSHDNYPPLYGHHYIEETRYYTFKRVQ